MRDAILVLILLAFSSFLSAQNSDLGILFGGVVDDADVSSGSVDASTQGTFQVNYAWQFKEGHFGRLYGELPLVLTSSEGGTVQTGNGSPVRIEGDSDGSIFLVPGIRYQFNVSPRVAFYLSAGGGIHHRSREIAEVDGLEIRTRTQSKTSPAASFGGGIDFRLTRLLSLRAEVRDLIGNRELPLDSHHNVAFQAGLALHF